MDGLSVALYDAFPSCKIYSEQIEQGLEEPCFLITVISSLEKQLLKDRVQRDIQFDVLYFTKNDNAERQSVASDLYQLFKFVPLLDGSLIKGWNLSHDIVDGVLHFRVTFKPILRPVPEDVVKMHDYKLTERIGG
jgi:hypothetical protein